MKIIINIKTTLLICQSYIGPRMLIVEDTGKVWIPESPEPDFAVRVGETVFVLGPQKEKNIEYWIEGDYLCVDLHDPSKKIRTAKKIHLKLIPITSATLFWGFKKTKHGDLKVVNYKDPGIKEFVIEGDKYNSYGAQVMTGKYFWELAEFD